MNDLKIMWLRVQTSAGAADDNHKAGNNEKAISNYLEFFELMSRYKFQDLKYLLEPCSFNIALKL